MWECPLLVKLSVVPEQARLGPLTSLRSLPNSFNNISAFHPSSNGSHPASPTADRKSMAVGSPPQKQTGFLPRAGGGAVAAAAAAALAFDADKLASEDGGAAAKEPPPGGGDLKAGRAKSLLSEKLLNPYADSAGEDGRTIM
jgi:hypothetical protein